MRLFWEGELSIGGIVGGEVVVIGGWYQGL
jgi:hypothetical protein